MSSKAQIAFDFAAPAEEVTPQQPVQPVMPPVHEQQADQPVNVGVRLKALKPVIAAIEESAVQSEEEVIVVDIPVVKNTKKPKAAKSTRGRKSIKQSAAEADLINIPEDEILFQKQYYSMAEVTEMFHVNHSLLRFWENEFDIIQPRKNRKGDRHFRPVDIKNLHLIYHLLRQRKYTIEGAKDFLKKNKKAEERFEAIQKLQQIRAFLLELKVSL